MIYQTMNIQVPGSAYAAHLTTYFHQRSPKLFLRKRPVILICPGGGYYKICDRESEPVALRYVSMGYHAAVLRYSIAPARYPEALLQLASAVALLRENAEQWDIDPAKIIVQGFSAGGHLAASLGVFWNRSFLWERLEVNPEAIRPNGMILGYPVITSGPKGHQPSFQFLLGPEKSGIEEQSLENQVSEDTPPTFLWHTATDDVVPVENSLLFFQALTANGIPAQLHIFPEGPHGLALATEETAAPDGRYINPACAVWIELANQWLKHNFG